MTADTPDPSLHAEAMAVRGRVPGRSGVMDVSGLNVGNAKPERCPECSGKGCGTCGGRGYFLWKACPNCGDIGWDGLGDGIYACRISCGFRWTEDHPGWRIQRLPGEED